MEHFRLLAPRDNPKNATRAIERRIRQSHPSSALIDPRHCDVGVLNIEHWVSGHQGGSVPVRSKTEVNEIEYWRRTCYVPENQRVLGGCRFQIE
jgi:hypothetical protein